MNQTKTETETLQSSVDTYETAVLSDYDINQKPYNIKIAICIAILILYSATVFVMTLDSLYYLFASDDFVSVSSLLFIYCILLFSPLVIAIPSLSLIRKSFTWRLECGIRRSVIVTMLLTSGTVALIAAISIWLICFFLTERFDDLVSLLLEEIWSWISPPWPYSV